MTSKVTIEAHCATDKQVKVVILAGPQIIEEFTVQDGEKQERYIYDDRAVHATEEKKG